MKSKLLLLTGLLCLGCTQRYDGEIRILADVTIVDSSGNPIPGARASVTTDSHNYNDFYYPYDSDIITFGDTDANGRVRMVFPLHEDDQRVYTVGCNVDEIFEDGGITGMTERDFGDYKVPVSTLTLYRPDELAGLSIETINTSEAELISLRITGPVGGYKQLAGSRSAVINTFARVKKNSVVTLEYVTLSAGIRQEHSVDVTIGTEDLTYQLNF